MTIELFEGERTRVSLAQVNIAFSVFVRVLKVSLICLTRQNRINL